MVCVYANEKLRNLLCDAKEELTARKGQRDEKLKFPQEFGVPNSSLFL